MPCPRPPRPDLSGSSSVILPFILLSQTYLIRSPQPLCLLSPLPKSLFHQLSTWLPLSSLDLSSKATLSEKRPSSLITLPKLGTTPLSHHYQSPVPFCVAYYRCVTNHPKTQWRPAAIYYVQEYRQGIVRLVSLLHDVAERGGPLLEDLAWGARIFCRFVPSHIIRWLVLAETPTQGLSTWPIQ